MFFLPILRFNWKPAAVVYPNDSEGVAAAIKCGADNGVKVNARSGGHSCTYLLLYTSRYFIFHPSTYTSPSNRRRLRARG